MKNKCTVIQINGLRGMLIVGFVIMCAIAGFVVFPAWLCQHAWNYVAGFIVGMPLMELKHGALLWIIIALVSYVTMFGKVKISHISAGEADFAQSSCLNEDELIETINEKIRERLENKELSEKEEIKK